MNKEIDTSYLNHIGVLEISIADIIENQKGDVNYIQQTLYFLRFVMVRLYLQKASRELFDSIRQSYQELLAYNAAVLKTLSKTQATIPDSLQIADSVTLKQLKTLGLYADDNVSSIEFTKEDDERLRFIQERAKQRRGLDMQAQRKHVPDAVVTENTVTQSLLKILYSHTGRS